MLIRIDVKSDRSLFNQHAWQFVGFVLELLETTVAFYSKFHLILGVSLLISFLCAHRADAQRVRFPTDPVPVQNVTLQPPIQLPGQIPAYNSIPPYTGPINSGPMLQSLPNTAPSASISPPNFDGFSTQPQYFPAPPAYPGTMTPQPSTGFSGSVQPMIVPPTGTSGAPSYSQTPPYLFPNPSLPQFQSPQWQMPQMPQVNGPSTWFDGWGSGATDNSGSQDWIGRSFWSKFQDGPYLRLLQEVRFGHTYLYGGENNQLQMNDTEFGTTLNYPNFFGSGEPLRISPGFIQHLWDGPQPPPPGLIADLPARAYSVFLASDWSSPTDRQLGIDVNFSTGIYSDFQAFTSDAFRIKGTALGRLRLAPDLTFRFGATYLDRLRFKVLPAVGFFWTPNADARLELFFPYPKIARKLPQVGNAELWSYMRAELGGDTFSIERANGKDDQVDIVDYRIMAGIEWNGYSGASGFAEFGYVFNRDLYYRYYPPPEYSLDDTFAIRVGLAF
jgi:hypothetical protein